MTPPSALASGAPLTSARGAVIMLHGRGASAEDILALADEFAQPDLAYLAPQAPGASWYPCSFLAPLDKNEPALSRALARVGGLVTSLAEAGVPAERVVLLGFSQDR